jgi:ADP-heptose:LPS heptosyltransferase
MVTQQGDHATRIGRASPMKMAAMRRADRWLGVPICALLTAWRWVADLLRGRRPIEVRRILFVKLAEQGTTILAYPALRKAVEKVGRENVYFLVFEENRFIVDALDIIPPHNVLAIRTHGLCSTVFGALRALWQARRAGIDTAIDFEFFARSSAALSYLSGARRRVGFHATGGEAAWRGDLMTHRLAYNPHLHTGQTYQVMVEALDVPPEQLPAFDRPPPPAAGPPAACAAGSLPQFAARPEEIEEVRDMLRQAAPACPPRAGPGRVAPLILLNANAGDLLPLRRWPSERYVDLARRLLAKYPDLALGFTGAPDEATAVAPLVAHVASPRCINLAGRTTLRQLLILYGLAEVLVTNDSGPAHFAALTPIDTVTLFGPETPALFAAPTPRAHVLYAGLPCSPCVSAYNGRLSRCRDNLCMQRITVEQVFTEVCKVFEARRSAHV